MNSIFSEDSIFISMLQRISDIVVLNILFLLTCLPVFTIGAALTALNYTAITAIKYEDGYIAKKYFKSFISNFKQSTLVWLIMLFVGCVLFFDVYFWVSYWKLQHTPWKGIMIVVSVIMAFVFLMAFMWIFPILSKFSNTTGKSIWNALALSVRHFPWTLLLCITAFLVPLFSYLSFPFLMAMVVCGFGALAYAYAFLFQYIFKQYVTDGNLAAEEAGEQEADDDAQAVSDDEPKAGDDTQAVSDDEPTADDASQANLDDEPKADDASQTVSDDEEKTNGEHSAAGTIKRKGRMVQYINAYDSEDTE